MQYGRHCEPLITNRRCVIHIGAVSDTSPTRWNMCCSNSNLTSSLPEPVKFPGWKMHECAYKQCIFGSCNTCTFSAMRLDEKSFTCQCKKEDKKAEGFQILHFHWSFSSDIMAVKGLTVTLTSICTAQTPPDWHFSSSTYPYTNNNGEIKYICAQQKLDWWFAHDMHRGI